MLEKIEKFQILLLAVVLGISGIIATVIFTKTMSKDVITVTGSYSQTMNDCLIIKEGRILDNEIIVYQHR